MYRGARTAVLVLRSGNFIFAVDSEIGGVSHIAMIGGMHGE
jgi:hypothetical protein